MPIDLHIDDNIKYRILSNAFVNFGALLFDACRNDITDEQAALASKQKTVASLKKLHPTTSYVQCNLNIPS